MYQVLGTFEKLCISTSYQRKIVNLWRFLSAIAAFFEVFLITPQSVIHGEKALSEGSYFS